MSDEQDKLKLSLEPPKLFGRKKKSDAMGTTKRTSPAPDARRGPQDDRPAVAEADTTDATADDTAPTSPVEVADETPTENADTAVLEAPEETPIAEESVPEPEPTPAPNEPAPEPEAPATTPKKAPKKAPVTAVVPPVKKATSAKPAAKPAPKPAAKPAAATTRPTEPAKKPARPRAKLAPDIEPEPLTSIEREDAEILARPEGPLLPLYPAAALTGAVVGAAMVVLTWLSLRGCEAVRGTASCGGGPGFLLLVATFVLCILLGSTLLKTFSIPDPGSSSFLAVGLVAVIALLFLIDALDHWSMLIVIPLISVAGFLASVWVTKTFVEPTQTEP